LKEELKDELEIIEQDEVDMDAFREAVEPVYENLDDTFKEYVEIIQGM